LVSNESSTSPLSNAYLRFVLALIILSVDMTFANVPFVHIYAIVMKFFGALAALSMAALVLASPDPLVKRQSQNATTDTTVSTPATTTTAGTSTITTTHTTGTDTGTVTTSTSTGTGTTTATSTKTGNAGVANIRPFHISAPMLTAIATTAGGVLFGAWVSL